MRNTVSIRNTCSRIFITAEVAVMSSGANFLKHGVYHRRLGHVGLRIIALAKRPPIDRSATPTVAQDARAGTSSTQYAEQGQLCCVVSAHAHAYYFNQTLKFKV